MSILTHLMNTLQLCFERDLSDKLFSLISTSLD